MKLKRIPAAKILWAFLALFFLWLAFQIPYTHDDWDWGNPIGITQLLYATVNSRYAGNLVVVLLTRSELLKTLVMGLFFFLMPVYAVYVCTGEKPEAKLKTIALLTLSYALFTGFPVEVWNQTNGWVSGFANYSFSCLVLALYIYLASRLFEKTEVRAFRPGKLALCFFTAFALQLFLENITVYIAAASLCLFAAQWIYAKKPSADSFALMLGALAGAVLMFSSNIYGGLLSTGQAVGDYRQLIVDLDQGLIGLALQVAYNYTALILSDLYKSYWEYCFILLLGLSILLFKARKSLSVPLFFSTMGANLLLSIYFLGQSLGIDEFICFGNSTYMAVLKLIASALFFCIVSLQLFILEKDRKSAVFAFSLWFSAPAVMLPLTVVNTIGPRSFFTSLFFIVLVTIFVFKRVFAQLSEKQQNAVLALSFAALLIICLKLGTAYYDIGHTKQQWNQIIAEAKDDGRQEIILPAYKDKSYLWLPDPNNRDSFKEFFDIDKSVYVITR